MAKAWTKWQGKGWGGRLAGERCVGSLVLLHGAPLPRVEVLIGRATRCWGRVSQLSSRFLPVRCRIMPWWREVVAERLRRWEVDGDRWLT